jgi:hypothetical protein
VYPYQERKKFGLKEDFSWGKLVENRAKRTGCELDLNGSGSGPVADTFSETESPLEATQDVVRPRMFMQTGQTWDYSK